MDEVDGGLVYSLPVDSGHVSASFAFAVRPEDLAVLLGDPYRRAVLECVAHTVLQAAMGHGGASVTQTAFDRLVLTILHGTLEEVARLVADVDRAHHIRTEVYVREAMARHRGGR